MPNKVLILPCLEIWSPVCSAATPCYLLEQKDVIPLVPQHAGKWETEAHDTQIAQNSSMLSTLLWRSWIRWGSMGGGQGVFDGSQVLPRALGWCWERNNLSQVPRTWGCPELASQPVPQPPPVMFGLLQRFAVCWEIIKKAFLIGDAV